MRNQLEAHAHVASSSVSAARLSLLTLFLRSFRAVFACPERPKDHLVSLYTFCFAFQSNEFYWNVCMAPQTNCTARFGLLFFLCLRFFLFFLRLRLFVLLAWLLSLVTPRLRRSHTSSFRCAELQPTDDVSAPGRQGNQTATQRLGLCARTKAEEMAFRNLVLFSAVFLHVNIRASGSLQSNNLQSCPRNFEVFFISLK